MLFIGIDLAWSEKNGTGIAIIKGDKKKGKIISAKLLYSDEEIINYIKKEVDNKNAIIAIDAPLVVPNKTGRRFAEDVTGLLFRKYNAGAYPANRERLSLWSPANTIRGEEILKALEKNKFEHSPFVKKYEKSRKFFEVYPHPSMVVLFKLDSILKYKNKPNRDYNFRYKEFDKYLTNLKNLNNPSLNLSQEILNKNVRKLKAASLKEYEDVLDSVFCAYIAHYYWANPDKCSILGDVKRGYILTPVFDHMKKQLESMKSQKQITNF